MTVVNIFSGLLTPLIAIIAVYIAYQQFIINRNRLRLDLYEKRFRVFNETKKVLHKINQDSKIDLIELRDFKFSTNESKFLFEVDITDYLEEIKKNSIELNHLTDDLNKLNQYPVGSKDREDKVQRYSELTSWFTEQYLNIEIKFEKYLDFKKL